MCCYSAVPGVSTGSLNLIDLVTVGKFCFHFSRVLDNAVDCVNVNPALGDA